MKHAIIYLHGFNSASLDLSGNLLISKQKLAVLSQFCQKKQVLFYTPNVDYRDFAQLIADLAQVFSEFEDKGYKTLFMGSSLGGFTSEYMAMKTDSIAIMINPAISPTNLLKQFIGVDANLETKQAYNWNSEHCEQFKRYEDEMDNASSNAVNKTIFVDLADELIDAQKTLEKYQHIAEIFSFEGGSHSFDHINEALPIIERIILS